MLSAFCQKNRSPSLGIYKFAFQTLISAYLYRRRAGLVPPSIWPDVCLVYDDLPHHLGVNRAVVRVRASFGEGV